MSSSNSECPCNLLELHSNTRALITNGNLKRPQGRRELFYSKCHCALLDVHPNTRALH